MPELLRGIGTPTPRMSDLILEAIRKYSKRADLTVVNQIFGIPSLTASDQVAPANFFNDLDPISPVGTANINGDSLFGARDNHVHEGVHSNSVYGQPQIFGDVQFQAGDGIVLTQSGTGIIIAAQAGIGGLQELFHLTEYFQIPNTGSKTVLLSKLPTGEVSVYFDGFRKFRDLDYSQIGQTIVFNDTIDLKNVDRVVVDYFYNLVAPGVTPTNFFHIVEYYQVLTTTPKTFLLLYHPLDDVEVYFAGIRRFKDLDYTQNDCLITFLDPIDLKDSDRVIFDYLSSGLSCS